MEMKFAKAKTVNGRPATSGDHEVFVKKTTDVLSHWAPSADAFGPDEWTRVGWVTKVGAGRWCFLKPGDPGWGPARRSRELAALAVIL